MPGFARRLLIQPLNIMSKIDVGGNVFPAGGDALLGVFFLFHDQFKPLADTGSRFIVYLFNQIFDLSCFQGLVGGRDDGLNGFPGFEPGIRGAFPGPVNPDQGSKGTCRVPGTWPLGCPLPVSEGLAQASRVWAAVPPR